MTLDTAELEIPPAIFRLTTEKARANLDKHGVRFSDAESILFDLGALTREDEYAEGEERFVSIGRDTLGSVLTVVYSYQGDAIRMISARPATRFGEKSV